MTDSLYVKTAGGILPIAIAGSGGGSGTVIKKLVSSVRPSVLTAGSAFTVPEYVIGSNNLELFWNGLLLAKGSHYTEESSTTVTFTFDLTIDDVVVATVYNATTGTATRTVQTDTQRTSVITAGTSYQVPNHPVLENKLQVYLDGLQYTDFTDVSTTTISFSDDIPTTAEIVCVVG